MSSLAQDIGLDGEKNLSCIFSCSTGPCSMQSPVFEKRKFKALSMPNSKRCYRVLEVYLRIQNLCLSFLPERWGREKEGLVKSWISKI